jgi:hypothetical protein
LKSTCSSCGGTDHQQKSSKKCPNYVAQNCNTNNQNQQTTLTASNCNDANTNDNNLLVENEQTKLTTNNCTNANTSDNNVLVETEDSLINEPTFYEIPSEQNKGYTPITDVSSHNFKLCDSIFNIKEGN